MHVAAWSLRSAKQQLLSCASCLLSKYCSKDCQRQDWKSGHKNRCHLFEADRKLSTVFAKSLGPGLVWSLNSESHDITLNDPTLSLADKVIQWNFLNVHNHLTIACAALKNSKKIADTVNVCIFLRLVEECTGSKYDNRSFLIERVALLPREDSDDVAARTKWKYGNTGPDYDPKDSDHCKLFVGYCLLPTGKMADTQQWIIPTTPNDPRLERTVLPPNFDLHRYITHVNRGVTHFHASFWELGRDMSDAELESAEQPPVYCRYAFDHLIALSGLKGQGVIGVVNEDGSRTPIFKRAASGHIRVCAPGETDSDGPAAYKKLLTDPSRIVKKIADDLETWYLVQEMGLGLTEKRVPF
ncbi:hypothetical protein B0H19DRAFT_1069918 [Mycena capillaripes]|nr:hypothetical protein B0H19DRAFT_1069918 [Mycena capillaripes]